MFLRWWAAAVTNMTEAEKAMEPEVASLGLPYRVQHPIWALRYRLDFAFPTMKVALEIDDPSHTAKAKRAKDKVRTAKLKKAGWTVIRTTNEAVLKDPRKALEQAFRSANLDFPPKEKHHA